MCCSKPVEGCLGLVRSSLFILVCHLALRRPSTSCTATDTARHLTHAKWMVWPNIIVMKLLAICQHYPSVSVVNDACLVVIIHITIIIHIGTFDRLVWLFWIKQGYFKTSSKFHYKHIYMSLCVCGFERVFSGIDTVV